jgi:hypothetical protein
MKFDIKSTKKGFSPFTLNINIETLKEAAMFYAMFNYSDHVDVVPELSDLRRKILRECSEAQDINHAGVDYDVFYSSKVAEK